jgi:uncharacterized protein YoaH (UPF0181 family)
MESGNACRLSHQQEACAMCELIRELYPKGKAEDERAIAIIRGHFRNQHSSSVTPYLVIP